MPSIISRMLNETVEQPQPQQQQQLPTQIQTVKQLMQQCQNTGNPQQFINNLMQSNPSMANIAQLVKNGNSLESIARSMAQARGININTLIQELLH